MIRRRAALPALLVGAAALAVRLLPVLCRHALGATTDYDGGVYVGAAVRLAHGVLPYRDYVFVQPPGAALIFMPLAALPEPAALVAGHLLMMVIGALNAVLVYAVLSRHGRRPALLGAGLYAVWGVPIAAERTVLLEPFLTAASLIAVLLLRRSGRRHELLAGVVLGAAIGIKLWGAAALLAVVVVLLWRRQLARCARVLFGTLVAIAVLFAPFLVLAPGRLIHQVFVAQLGRDRSADGVARVLGFAGARTEITGHLLRSVLVAALLACAVLLVLLAIRSREGRAWTVLLVAQCALIGLAPVYYFHYPAVAAGSVAVLFGLVAIRWSQVGTAVAVTVLVALCAYQARPITFQVAIDGPTVRAFTADKRCVWSDSPDVLLAADQVIRSATGRCDAQLDLFGVGLARDDAAAVAVRQAELRRSDAVILTAAPAALGWNGGQVRAFRADFRRDGGTSALQFWIPRRSTA